MATSHVGDVPALETEISDLEGWSGDPLAQYLAAAWRNTVQAFTSESQQYRVIAEIDRIYRELVMDDQIRKTTPLLATFLVRSHGAFLAAASLALSGQVAEAYVLMSATLDTAVHGLLVADSLENQQLWISRNDDKESQDHMHAVFSGSAPLEHLRQIDAATAGVYEQLVTRTDARLLHANAQLDSSDRTAAVASGLDFARSYFVRGDEVQRSCLRSLAQAGICCLTIFYYVFPEQYREHRLDLAVKQLRRGH